MPKIIFLNQQQYFSKVRGFFVNIIYFEEISVAMVEKTMQKAKGVYYYFRMTYRKFEIFQ